MPGFIKTPKNEAQWSKAKAATSKSKNKGESSFTDQDWALTNKIYHEMEKSLEFAKHIDDPSYVDEMIDVLKKLAKAIDEEDNNAQYSEDDNEENDTDNEEFDPYAHALRESSSEYSEDEDEDAHQGDIDEDLGSEEGPDEESTGDKWLQDQQKKETSSKEVGKSRFNQPTPEELNEIRRHTLPWERRAREHKALKSEAHVNPVLAQQGDIIEARNKHHGDRQKAYQELINSAEYASANPIVKLKMDKQFKQQWHEKNPENMQLAMEAHHEAHKKAEKYKDLHAAEKEAGEKHLLQGGGHGGEGYSREAGAQHAGGSEGDHGTEASIDADPASTFAQGNQEFIKQYAKKYVDKKNKATESELEEYKNTPKTARDIESILGPAAAQDPKFKKFFEQYLPLIQMNKGPVMNKLGLDKDHPVSDVLEEAGMHGLYQAINDYDHNHPSKASFATHASKKINGLMMTAAKSQDQVSNAIRQAQKEYDKVNAAPTTVEVQAPKEIQVKDPKTGQMITQNVAVKKLTREPKKVEPSEVIAQSNHSNISAINERHQRVKTMRRAQGVKPVAAAIPQPSPEMPDESSDESLTTSASVDLPTQSRAERDAMASTPAYSTPKSPTPAPPVSKIVRR
jgi:hypothetical protein